LCRYTLRAGPPPEGWTSKKLWRPLHTTLRPTAPGPPRRTGRRPPASSRLPARRPPRPQRKPPPAPDPDLVTPSNRLRCHARRRHRRSRLPRLTAASRY
jgi:hypothetical protein